MDQLIVSPQSVKNEISDMIAIEENSRDSHKKFKKINKKNSAETTVMSNTTVQKMNAIKIAQKNLEM